MIAETLKLKLKEIFGDQLSFNKEFDSHAEKIKNIEQTLIPWCQLLKEKQIKPIVAPKAKDSIIFIKKIGSSNRCIVIKIINSKFKEIHLADHKYYDNLRKKLGIKKNNKMY